jgi:hypothetical protein
LPPQSKKSSARTGFSFKGKPSRQQNKAAREKFFPRGGLIAI